MSLFKRNKTKETQVKNQPIKADAVKVDSKKQAIKSKTTVTKNKLDIKKGQLSYNVLEHPLMTEKINLQMSQNQYVFAVKSHTNKIEIKKAIQETYGIIPTKVRVINVLGKSVRSGRGQYTHRRNWKKAVVTLPAGKKIDIYEG